MVTIDGPAGTGKSSVARTLAEQLGFAFLDTGAMYRAVAGVCLRDAVDPEDKSAAEASARSIHYDAAAGVSDADGLDLRTTEVTRAASLVARHPGVRETLIGWQRAFAGGRPTVTEGRDQGTVVFPDAPVKFYLDASAEERAARRVRELEELGKAPSFSETLRQIRDRDDRDRNRPIAPLRPADDAVLVDTTHMTIDEVVSRLEQTARQRLNAST